jgi:tetratricopeptide (TPR) repeat protein
MPKPSQTEQSYQKKPSALEMFTDRVSERELLARLMAPHEKGAEMVAHDFLTVFYGVGGVGKSTLCRKVVASSAVDHPEVMLVVLNLDFGKWTRDSGFAPFLVALVEQFLAVGISTPLVQTLLLMYSRADSGLQVSQGSAGLWSGAVAVLDQATQAVGIPGIGLVIQGAQWLKDRKKQADVAKRLRDLGLWPDDNEGKADLLDMEEKMAGALYEDLKAWAVEGRNLRILLDGFERIQSRERRRDCQMLVQRFAGFIAASEDPELASRIRMLVFGRDKLRWDELYEDPGWNDYWSQHLLAGLGETDAIEFLNKHSDWLSFHGDTVGAAAIQNHTKQILDAADEQIGGERSIYPYYLDLSVDLVLQAAREGRTPDLGKTPGELQDRFFRYLDPAERHLLKLLALAETFDAVMFDALVRNQRVSGYAVGTFLTTVAEGRSYVSSGDHGGFRFHRLMEDALQDQWLLSQPNREQGCKLVAWLLEHLATRFQGKQRKDWTAEDLEIWRRGVEIIISQGEERDLMDRKQTDDLLSGEPWKIDFPATFDSQEAFLKRRLESREKALGAEHPDTLVSVNIIGNLLRDRGDYDGAEALYRRALEGGEKVLGAEHPSTLGSVNNLGILLSDKGDYDGAEALFRRALEGRKKALGAEHPDTLSSVNNLGSLLSDKGDYDGAEALYRWALEGREKALGAEHPDTLSSVNNLGSLLSDKGDYDGAEALYRRALEGGEKALGAEHPSTLESVNNLGILLGEKGDYHGAKEFFLRALDGYEKTLGVEHPSTLGIVHNLGILLGEKGDYHGAKEFFLRALDGYEKTLGVEHPSTLGIVHNLGNLLRNKGDCDGAEALYRRALVGYEKALGAEHLETIASAYSLASVINRGNRRPEAISLLRRFASLSSAARDAVAYNLACYECLEGNHEEAKRLIAKHLTIQPEQKLQALADDDFAAIRDFIQTL